MTGSPPITAGRNPDISVDAAPSHSPALNTPSIVAVPNAVSVTPLWACAGAPGVAQTAAASPATRTSLRATTESIRIACLPRRRIPPPLT